MTKKNRSVSVTMKQNADGIITMRSYGGYDLRKIMQAPKADKNYDDIDDISKTALVDMMKDADK